MKEWYTVEKEPVGMRRLKVAKGTGAFKVLDFLAEHGPSRKSEIKKGTGLSLSGEEPSLAKLVSMGLVSRSPEKDYYLTESGNEVLNRSIQVVNELITDYSTDIDY